MVTYSGFPAPMPMIMIFFTASSPRLPSGRFFQVALKNSDMHGCLVRRLRPEVLSLEADVVGRFVLRLQIVGGGVRKRVRWRFSDNNPDFSANVARHADMTGDELVLDPHPVTDLERLARECVGPSLGA